MIKLKVEGNQFVDEHGRTVLLRGVNLGGSTKTPVQPDGATHRYNSLDNRNTTISFVGRPFPEEEADEHFGRLRHWGFNTVRFLVTWEAIEPHKPQSYDHRYLDYVSHIIAKAADYNLYVIVDAHQDVWSRFTGGDGAPGWTLEKVGFDLSRLHATGAASLHQELGDSYPDMRWLTNYNKLGAATMFTLFFAGNDFAPFTIIDKRPIQDYLQWHYINAFKQLASRLKNMPHVLGYDLINEPHTGYIGLKNFQKDKEFFFKEGPTPTPAQSLLLGAGYPQPKVSNYVKRRSGLGTRKKGTVSLNPEGICVWQDNMPNLWQENQVWELVQGRNGPQAQLRRKDYFSVIDGREVNFNQDYYAPFIERFAKAIRTIHPEATLFIEPALGQELPELTLENTVNAGHWYDVVQRFTRRYLPKVGIDVHKKRKVPFWKTIDKSFAQQIGKIKQDGISALQAPSLVGEFGIAYDLDQKKAYADQDYTPHLHLLDRTYRALDANHMSGTIWNYTADNNHAHGDNWNKEDQSIYSRSHLTDVEQNGDWDAGGRALGAICRPYAISTGGTPIKMAFDLATRTFEYTFKRDEAIMVPTEIYVPDYHYSVGIEVAVTDGKCEYDQDTQTLCYFPSGVQEEHTIRITRQRDVAELLDEVITTADNGPSYRLQRKFVNTNNIRIHTVQVGPEDGEMVILLHSFPEFWYGWREQIPYLVRQGYRVVVPDLRGTYLSSKPEEADDYKISQFAGDIISLLDSLGRDSTYLAGHGLGGLLAWWLAAKYPSRIRKAAVLNMAHPTVLTDKKAWKPLGKQFGRKPSDPEKTPSRLNKILRRTPKSLETEMTAVGLIDTFTAEDWEQYQHAWQIADGLESGRLWTQTWVKEKPVLHSPRVTIPLLLLWGAKDPILSRDLVAPSLDLCDDGRARFFEHASHWLQHDEPDQVNLYLSRFFKQND